MPAIDTFRANFTVATNLIELYTALQGLKTKEAIPADLVAPICRELSVPAKTTLRQACSGKIAMFVKHDVAAFSLLVEPGRLDFLLRQAVVSACAALEHYFWDVLQENMLVIAQALHCNVHRVELDLVLTLEQYLSLKHSAEPDEWLRRHVLDYFEKKTLYGNDRIAKISEILGVRDFWKKVAKAHGRPAEEIRGGIQDLVTRRINIVHRADRPGSKEKEEDIDGFELKKITIGWVQHRVSLAHALVDHSDELFRGAVGTLQNSVSAALEQLESRNTLGKAGLLGANPDGGTGPPLSSSGAGPPNARPPDGVADEGPTNNPIPDLGKHPGARLGDDTTWNKDSETGSSPS